MAKWSSSLQLSDIPVEVKQVAIRALIDTVGVIVAGATDEIAPAVHSWISERQRADGVVVPPFGVTTDPETAAFALGILAHALELDDLHPSLIGHPSSVVVSVLLAIGPFVQATGDEIICAYVTGAELAAHLGRAIAAEQYNRGWHTTSTIGVLAATATTARLLKMECATTAHAFGFAASMAAGVRANFGSSAKPIHVGQAASHGVTSALLSRNGFRASLTALEGSMGYLDNFTGNRHNNAVISNSVGKQWELINPGLQIKLYACCGAAHRPIDALIDLMQEVHFTYKEVEQILVFVDPVAATLLKYPAPSTVGEARFSLQHCLAAIIVDGKLSLEHFTDDALKRDDLREFRRRICMKIHPDLVEYTKGLAFAELHVHMRSGVQYMRRVHHPKGSRQRPISQAELEKKFFDCVHLYAPEKDWNPAIQAIRNLESNGSIATVVNTLTMVN